MNKIYLHRRFLGGHIFAVVGLCLCLYFGFHAVQGNRGIVRLFFVQKEITVLTAQSEALMEERKALERKVAMMRPGSVDRDLLEERARELLGYTYKDEYSVLGQGS